MDQRQRPVYRRKHRHQASHGREDGHAHSPATTTIAQAVLTHGAYNVSRIRTAADCSNARFGEYEFQLMLHALFEPTQPVSSIVFGWCVANYDKYHAAVHLHRKAAHVVRKRVQRASTIEVESRVMPVTGQ